MGARPDQARVTAPKSAVRISGSVCWYTMRSRSSSVLEHTIRPFADETSTPPVLHSTPMATLGTQGLCNRSRVLQHTIRPLADEASTPPCCDAHIWQH